MSKSLSRLAIVVLCQVMRASDYVLNTQEGKTILRLKPWFGEVFLREAKHIYCTLSRINPSKLLYILKPDGDPSGQNSVQLLEILSDYLGRDRPKTIFMKVYGPRTCAKKSPPVDTCNSILRVGLGKWVNVLRCKFY
jgi:hypothetical protein